MLIKNFEQVFKIAEREGPKRMTVMSAGDSEVIQAVKEARGRGFIEPVLIGDENAIKEISENVEFDLSGVKIFHEVEPQAVAYRSMDMAITGEVEMQMKGRLPTSYIYKVVIEKKFSLPDIKKFSVIDFHDLPFIDHFIATTDSGISINPDFEAKLESIRNAILLFHILGYPQPRVLALSAARGMNYDLASAKDKSLLAAARAKEEIGDCIIEDALSLADVFLGKDGILEDYEYIDFSRAPHILLVPNLDSGNTLAKLHYLFEEMKTAHIIGGTKTPLVIPPRTEDHEMMVFEIAFGVVIAHLVELQGEQ
jgi:phosphate butyryltransferase